MKRYFIIGDTIKSALKKYSYADNGNVILLDNPLDIESDKLELKIIIGYLGIGKNEKTKTENQYLLWVNRMYPDLLKYRNFSIAIKFTKKEKEIFIEYVKEVKKKKINISNIYRIYNFNM